ncbi:glutathione S-transferase family protein [Jannaschia sp.]|nr:glutathione S-transferase family protein [Jannaschia sp.]
MPTLWGRETSINVQKVMWVLAENGQAYDRIDAGGRFGGLDAADYRAMNPSGRVPTLQDGALTLWESNAICRYLVDAYRGPLWCPEAADRARADMWMEWFQNGVYADFISLFYQTVRLAPDARDPRILAEALTALHSQFAIAEQALAGRDYLLGPEPTLADVPFGACLYRYFTLDLDRPSHPQIQAYYARLCDRPAYRRAIMVDYSSLRAPA